jgi:hypothetical protein
MDTSSIGTRPGVEDGRRGGSTRPKSKQQRSPVLRLSPILKVGKRIISKITKQGEKEKEHARLNKECTARAFYNGKLVARKRGLPVPRTLLK